MSEQGYTWPGSEAPWPGPDGRLGGQRRLPLGGPPATSSPPNLRKLGQELLLHVLGMNPGLLLLPGRAWWGRGGPSPLLQSQTLFLPVSSSTPPPPSPGAARPWLLHGQGLHTGLVDLVDDDIPQLTHKLPEVQAEAETDRWEGGECLSPGGMQLGTHPVPPFSSQRPKSPSPALAPTSQGSETGLWRNEPRGSWKARVGVRPAVGPQALTRRPQGWGLPGLALPIASSSPFSSRSVFRPHRFQPPPFSHPMDTPAPPTPTSARLAEALWPLLSLCSSWVPRPSRALTPHPSQANKLLG